MDELARRILGLFLEMGSESLDLHTLFRLTEPAWITEMLRIAEGHPARELLNGLFGPVRQLYKRVAQYGFHERRETYLRLARRPYSWLVALAERFASLAGRRYGLFRRSPPRQMTLGFA